MSIIATAPVPAHCRTHADDTDQFPLLVPTPYLTVAGGAGPNCPTWCDPREHTTLAPIVAGEPTVVCHYSAERVVEAVVTDLGGKVTQRSEISLQVVAHDDGGPDGLTEATIFLAVGGDTPMTAATARELAAALLDLADRVDGAR